MQQNVIITEAPLMTKLSMVQWLQVTVTWRLQELSHRNVHLLLDQWQKHPDNDMYSKFTRNTKQSTPFYFVAWWMKAVLPPAVGVKSFTRFPWKVCVFHTCVRGTIWGSLGTLMVAFLLWWALNHIKSGDLSHRCIVTGGRQDFHLGGGRGLRLMMTSQWRHCY